MGPSSFRSPFEEPAILEHLVREQCQLWRARLEVPDEDVQAFWLTLSPEERAIAQSFRFPQFCSRYIIGRGLLRKILGQYLREEPRQLAISARVPNGKPVLEHSEDLRFNVSHSGPVWVCAVTWGKEVGIDIEEIQTDFDWLPVARQIFTPEEQAQLESVGPIEGRQLFFQYWTRKEALAKATGEGLLDVPQQGSGKWEVFDLTEQLLTWGAYAASLAISNGKE